MRKTVLIALIAISSTAYAKDDSPRPRALAKKHPWHATIPSVTAVDVSCGSKSARYELAIDDRNWKLLTAASWSAIETPFGTFIRSKSKSWKRVKSDAWLATRHGELTIRDLVGAPVLPASWRIASAKRDGPIVRVEVIDHEQKTRRLAFDTVDHLWTLDRAKITKSAIVAKRRIPTDVEIRGCRMTRKVKPSTPKMPLRSEILGG